MWVALLFLVFFVLLVLRVPVGVSLALSSLLLILIQGMSPTNVVTRNYQTLDSFALMAIPFFLLLGMILAKTSLSHRILDLADLVVGRVRGGLGYVNVVSSMMMGGVSGSAAADVGSLGTVLIPMMRKKGYSASYAAAITAASSTMAVVLPPSVVMIVYGAFVNTSIGALFIAGILPGICMGLALLVVNFIHVRKHGITDSRSDALVEESEPARLEASQSTVLTGSAAQVAEPSRAGATSDGGDTEKRPDFRNRTSKVLSVVLPRLGHLLKQAERPVAGSDRRWYMIVARGVPTLLVPFVIVLGVRGGVFTATEAGAIALVYLLMLVVILYRELTWRRTKAISTEAVILYGQILFAIAASGAFGWILALLGAANMVQELIGAAGFTPGLYMVMVLIIFTVIGTFLDATPAVIIFAPLFSAGAIQLGIDPVHLGLVVVMVLGIGMITPPYGLSLLLASRLAGVTLWQGTKAALPFWLACYLVAFTFAMSESIALYLPRLLAPALF